MAWGGREGVGAVLWVRPSENRTEVERIIWKHMAPFDGLLSTTPVWTIYYRFLRRNEAFRNTAAVIKTSATYLPATPAQK
jgi:hypothetical protein